MRLSIIGMLVISLLAFTACQKSDSKPDTGSMTDAELINAIQKASNKQDIKITDLPDASHSAIAEGYPDDYADAAQFAPDLGYEVRLRCDRGPGVGERKQAYFNLRGRLLLRVREQDDIGDHGKRACFKFVLPVTFTMPDGTLVTIEEKEDWMQIRDWYKEHPDVKERPAVNYPVDIVFRSGKQVTLKNDQQMRRALESCKGDGEDKKRCFELVLPVSYIMPDGSTITIEKREDRKLLKQWYKENPGYDQRPQLQFPADVKWRDGTVQTINNEKEMKEAREKCEGDKRPCFRLVYPVTYIMPDGAEIMIDSKDDKEGWMEIKDWYKDHPDVQKKPVLKYPVDIKYKDGTIVTISNQEEMIDAKKACEDEDKG